MRMYPPPALQSNLTFTPFILPNFLLLYQTSHRILIHPHLVFSCPAGHPRPCVLVVSLLVARKSRDSKKKKKKPWSATASRLPLSKLPAAGRPRLSLFLFTSAARIPPCSMDPRLFFFFFWNLEISVQQIN